MLDRVRLAMRIGKNLQQFMLFTIALFFAATVFIKVTKFQLHLKKEMFFMGHENAARFFKAIHQDDELQAKLKATTDPKSFIKIAQERGYSFTIEELDTEIEKLSPEELAAVVNPGIAPRRHIMPR